jgi:hypothetical protein
MHGFAAHGGGRSNRREGAPRFRSQRLNISFCGKPLLTRNTTFSEDLRNEICPYLSPMNVRYADKIVSADHEVMICAREWSFESQLLQPPDQLCPRNRHYPTQRHSPVQLTRLSYGRLSVVLTAPFGA